MTTNQIAQATPKTIKTADHPDIIIANALKNVEQTMFDVVNSDVKVLRDASRHILEAGGKRVRPRLVVLSYLATGGNPKSLDMISPVAAAVELVHTASVVHDDINDHGVVRRGRASVNAIWGRTFALLTGDFLFTKVYELMAAYGDLNIILSEATTALVEGETLQASAVKENNFSRQVYMDIIARKTAALFRSGSVLGGKLAGADEEQIEALSQYGFNIGLAFQIVDDILDLIGDETQLGKTAGIDLEQGKGFASVVETPDVENGNGNGNGHADPIAEIRNKVLSAERIEEGKAQAEGLMHLAINGLSPIPASPYKDELIALAHLVVDRQI